jgi:hypothetical protein
MRDNIPPRYFVKIEPGKQFPLNIRPLVECISFSLSLTHKKHIAFAERMLSIAKKVYIELVKNAATAYPNAKF